MKTGYNRAQWGITHDDDGKLWFLGGASGLPSYFQFPIHYGNFQVEDQFAEGFEIPWGAPMKIGDMQGGMDQIRQPDGSLNRVTGAAGNDIYRGDRLPKECYGDLFYGEPVARIVRQVQPEVKDGLTQLHNVFQEQESEFLRSADPLFRPVDMATAPDGTMYIADMYHGIIQEGQWAQKGSYLRAKIEQYQLDKVVSLGRIWRITHESLERDKTPPRMLEESPTELLDHLQHPNGWWRDKAQQLIVLSRDLSVVPQLEKMTLEHKNLLARTHAIWSLEGLGALSADLIKTLLQDDHPKIRIQALRAGETLYKKGDKTLTSAFTTLISDPNEEVVIQAMLTAKLLDLPKLEPTIKQAMAVTNARGVQLVGDQILSPQQVRGFGVRGNPDLSKTQIELLEQGATIFNELCTQCHGNDGTGTPVGNGQVLAPPLAGSSRVQAHPEYVIRTVMHGLTGQIDGQDFPGGIMVGNKEQSDEWIASIVSFIRMNLSNDASFVSTEEVARVREATNQQSGPYRYDELIASVPQVLVLQDSWKISASHSASARIGGTASPKSAFNFEGWTTGEKQVAGMWFQVGLPQTTMLTEIHFTAPPISRGWRPGSPPPIQTYPRAYEVQVSLDEQDWTNTVATGQCDQARNIISFNPVKARYVRITQTGSVEDETEKAPWAMKELQLFGLVNNEEAVH